MNRTDDHHINDERLRWLSSQDYAQSEPGLIAAELLAARERVAELEAVLREDAATFFKLACTLKLAGMERAYVYHAKKRYELLGAVPNEVIRATSDSEQEPPPHLRGAIIQAHADTNGVPPTTGGARYGESFGRLLVWRTR